MRTSFFRSSAGASSPTTSCTSIPAFDVTNLDRRFDRFPWRDDAASLRAWQRGETGYPLVDAGMRQLWQTGWMHNRVRMVVASFLVKHLLIDWRLGEQWFWDTLVDADPANNPASWQWVPGCGADAAPYFRIFNPMTQGTKFDSRGDYVRRFVPELSALPADDIHAPWTAAPLELAAARVRLGASLSGADRRSPRGARARAFEPSPACAKIERRRSANVVVLLCATNEKRKHRASAKNRTDLLDVRIPARQRMRT